MDFNTETGQYVKPEGLGTTPKKREDLERVFWFCIQIAAVIAAAFLGTVLALWVKGG